MLISKFEEKLAQDVVSQWITKTLAPALVFWTGGAGAWLLEHDYQPVKKWIESQNPIMLACLSISGLLAIIAMGAFINWLHAPMIRILEGYWPLSFQWLYEKRTNKIKDRLNQKRREWKKIRETPKEERTAQQLRAYSRIDAEFYHYPIDRKKLMPTTLGNILRSAEEYSYERYGLDIIVCWPRLWLLMPKETIEPLSESREQLNSAARWMFLGLIFPIWMIWTKWAALSFLIFPFIYFFKMIDAAKHYGELIRTIVDLYRFRLYEAMKWPLPENPAQEKEHGEKLTQYLFRGFAPEDINYVTAAGTTDAR